MKVFKNIRKNNGTSQILFSWDGHNKSTLHCNGFNIRILIFQHSIPILLAFFSATSANPTVFRMRILWHFSLRRLPTLPFSECVFFGIFLCDVCQPYRFQNAYSLAFFSATSANPTVFRMRILWHFLCDVCQPYRFENAYSVAFFSAKSANSTVFRIPILLVTEIFLCEAYRFQKTSQTSDAQKNTPLEFAILFESF